MGFFSISFQQFTSSHARCTLFNCIPIRTSFFSTLERAYYEIDEIFVRSSYIFRSSPWISNIVDQAGHKN